MANSTNLLGPPAAAGKPPVAQPEEPLPSSETTIDPLINQTTKLDLTGKPPMGLTENLSATFLSTGNPCLDFFLHIVPKTPSDQLIQRLQLAWAHDPLMTLKLVCNLRGVRGTGKSDKEGFYTAALWLHKHHPKTLALNLRAFAEFGYFKDFPEILYRLIEGLEVRKMIKKEILDRRISKRRHKRQLRRERKEKRFTKNKEEGSLQVVQKEERACNFIDEETVRVLRKERDIAKAVRALSKYKLDANYRILFDCVADFFAELLNLDFELMKSKQYSKVSLAAKWCPSVDSSYDKTTLLCEAIARKIFPREGDKDYEEIEESHYAFRVRERLRKEVLVPLRKVLELPEVYMSANDWNSLRYNRVASVAMKTYKTLFLKHDRERFKEYLDNVKSGKAKIAAGALLPHEIIKALSDEDGGKVAELQWARMVDDLAKNGKLKNCIAVCDVSGSMIGIPMEVCVALGLLVSELSEEPWKGKVITFSENPELHLIEGGTLLEKTEFVRKMEWGSNTDFQKVFNRILDVAVENKLREDQLIKRVFVFSDMEFDQVFEDFEVECVRAIENDEEAVEYDEEDEDDEEESDEDSTDHLRMYKTIEYRRVYKKVRKSSWETDYELIRRKFKEKGYNKVPEIVFWNLRNSPSTPVVAKQSGVALVSGFSKNLLTLFLEEGGIVNPEDVMGLAIAGEVYKKLLVYD